MVETLKTSQLFSALHVQNSFFCFPTTSASSDECLMFVTKKVVKGINLQRSWLQLITYSTQSAFLSSVYVWLLEKIVFISRAKHSQVGTYLVIEILEKYGLPEVQKIVDSKKSWTRRNAK